MKIFKFSLFFLIIFLVTSASAADVGTIKKVEGHSWIVRGEQNIPALPGTRLYVEDIIMTGDDGALGLILRDDTIIAMGPQSEMTLAEFIFQPEKSRFSLVTQFSKGTFSYLSGVMSRLSPESVQVQTPVAMVAVNGTSFLVKVDE